MPRRFALLLTNVITAAVALLLITHGAYGLTAPAGGWAGVLVLIGVGVLSQYAAIDFGASRAANSSMAFIPFITGAVVFDPPIAILNALAVLVISALFFEHRRWFVHSFNFAQTSLSVGGAALVYSVLLGPGLRTTISPAAFTASVLLFFGCNMLLNSAGLASLHRVEWLPTLRQMVGPGGANLWYDFLASPFAAVTALLYRDYGVLGIVIIILPLLLLRHSYSSRQSLEKAIQALLNVLVKAIETRDPYTSGHSIRVATLAREIALDLGLSHQRAERVHMAALLHDIGKIDAAYATLISKPHNLSDEERVLIRTHAAKGADLLDALNSLPADVISAVRHHHERYDGSGYPDGLAGEAIPLFARIIMICDSVDAMLSDRPYRKALSLEVVQLELLRCAGSQFDPGILKVLIEHGTLAKAYGHTSEAASADLASDRVPLAAEAC